MRKHNSIIFAAIILVGLVHNLTLLAAPPHPETVARLQAEGKLQEYINMIASARERGVDAPEAPRVKSTLTTAIEFDTINVAVLLVDFSDHPWSTGYVTPNTAAFDSILFSQNRLNPTGSMTEYFQEVSYNKLFVTGTVFGVYRMPQTYAFYVNGEGGTGSTYPNNSRGLVVDAVTTANNAGVDFSLFDTWGQLGISDGYVDAVLIVHAGYGAEGTGAATDMHSHKWELGPYMQTIDGVHINVFTVQPEEYYGLRQASPIGIFCHEFGHVLGLPDLYDIDYIPETSKGLGKWSLMSSGVYLAQGKVPAQLDAWCKIYAGFVDPIEVSANLIGAPIPQVESNATIYKLWRQDVYGDEYFLVENRQKTGFDAYLPGEGLLIYHVDDGATFPNIDVNHYHVALEQADGLRQLELHATNEGDVYDPFPGGFNRRSFDDHSVPSSRAYDGSITQVSVWDISDSDSLMTANLDVSWSRPYFSMDSVKFADADLSGQMDLGENIRFYFFLRNDWMASQDVSITLSGQDVAYSFITPSVYFMNLPGDGTATNNLALPIELTIPSDIDPIYDTFRVSIVADGGSHQALFAFEKQIGQARILVVDDDHGGIYDTVLVRDLYRRRIPADVWSTQLNGSPLGVIMSLYPSVYWMTGDTATDLFLPAEIEAMKYYMDHNGSFCLTGQSLLKELEVDDSAFVADYLKCRYLGWNHSNVHIGVDGNQVFEGTEFEYYGWHSQIWNLSETLTPINGGKAAFRYNYGSGYTGVTYHGAYKLVFLDFGYEAIDVLDYPRQPRDTLLGRILTFFRTDFVTDISDTEPDNNLPAAFDLFQNYPNPFNPVTTIKYAVGPGENRGSGRTLLKIFNILGQEVITLVDREETPGEYSVRWEGTDNRGQGVAAGIYFYRLERGDSNQTRKMILLK